MPKLRNRLIRNVVAAAALLSGAVAQAADIQLISSLAMREAVSELAPAFEAASGHKVRLLWAGSAAITKRIGEGEIADVVIAPASNIDKLLADGRLAGARIDIAKSGIGAAVRAGMPKPDISSAEALKNAVLAAKSVAYSTGPSGVYLADLFRKMGIADQIRGKVTQTPTGIQIGEVVARGEVELGFQQISELLHVKGISYLGPLPGEIQHMTVFSAGVHKAAPQPDAAAALLRFFTSPAAAPFIRKSGMEPG